MHFSHIDDMAEGWSDVANELVAILYSTLMFAFPYWSYMAIRNNFKRLDEKDVIEKYGMLYEDMRTNDYHAAHYNNYFMWRRFAIGCTLIMGYEYTFF